MAYKDKRRLYDYNNRFQRENYDRITIIPRKDEGLLIRKAAADAGVTVSAFVLQAVREQMLVEETNNA